MSNISGKRQTVLATEKRQLIMRHPNCSFITEVEYCSLLISRARLERIDDNTTDLAGLHDRDTGRSYFIELEKLGVFR